MRWLAYLIAISFMLAGCSTAAAEPTVTISACPEDAVLVGTGDYTDGQYTAYKCGPALDDFNKPTPTPQVITETKEIEVYIEQTPKVCLDALDDADFIIEGTIDIMLGLLDYGTYDEDLGNAVLDRIDVYTANKTQCFALAESN